MAVDLARTALDREPCRSADEAGHHAGTASIPRAYGNRNQVEDRERELVAADVIHRRDDNQQQQRTTAIPRADWAERIRSANRRIAGKAPKWMGATAAGRFANRSASARSARIGVALEAGACQARFGEPSPRGATRPRSRRLADVSERPAADKASVTPTARPPRRPNPHPWPAPRRPARQGQGRSDPSRAPRAAARGGLQPAGDRWRRRYAWTGRPPAPPGSGQPRLPGSTRFCVFSGCADACACGSAAGDARSPRLACSTAASSSQVKVCTTARPAMASGIAR